MFISTSFVTQDVLEQAARESTKSAESAATSEMAGAEEAFMLLGDAEVQVTRLCPYVTFTVEYLFPDLSI